MNFDEARPEYYEGLRIFQQHTNQKAQLKKLLSLFWKHLKAEIAKDDDVVEDGHSLKTLVETPLVWRDIGSGDGSFTERVLESLREEGIPMPGQYEGIEPDAHFVAVSQELLGRYPFVKITNGAGFDGRLHDRGLCDIVSAFNALYFVQDWKALKEDLNAALKPGGLGLFIQNTLFTTKASEAFLGGDYKLYTAAIPTEVFFPDVPERAFDLVTNKATFASIRADTELTSEERESTVLIRRIIESMGGISTETDAGQQVARTYRSRILGEEYGGKGRYISDNLLLVCPHPEAPAELRAAVKSAMLGVREELA